MEIIILRFKFHQADLLQYNCAQDLMVLKLADYMFVIVVISVSFRESTLLRLETDTVTSLALDLKNLTNPCLFSTSSILLLVVFSFILILSARVSWDG